MQGFLRKRMAFSFLTELLLNLIQEVNSFKPSFVVKNGSQLTFDHDNEKHFKIVSLFITLKAKLYQKKVTSMLLIKENNAFY